MITKKQCLNIRQTNTLILDKGWAPLNFEHLVGGIIYNPWDSLISKKNPANALDKKVLFVLSTLP